MFINRYYLYAVIKVNIQIVNIQIVNIQIVDIKVDIQIVDIEKSVQNFF